MRKKLLSLLLINSLLISFSALSPLTLRAFADETKTACFVTNVGTPNGKAELPPSCKSTIGGKVPLYKQWDTRWGSNSYGGCGTMASSACGVTALAMIISYLTGKEVLPTETAKQAVSNGWRVCGAGTAHAAMTEMPKMYGLKGKTISWEEGKRYLKEGIPIIQVHGPGYFTGGGHYIVVTGINPDGTYAINDPNGKHRTKATEGQITASLNISWVIQK